MMNFLNKIKKSAENTFGGFFLSVLLFALKSNDFAESRRAVFADSLAGKLNRVVGRAAEDAARGIFADDDLISIRKKLHRVRVGLKREPAPEILWQHDASGLVNLPDDTQ